MFSDIFFPIFYDDVGETAQFRWKEMTLGFEACAFPCQRKQVGLDKTGKIKISLGSSIINIRDILGN